MNESPRAMAKHQSVQALNMPLIINSTSSSMRLQTVEEDKEESPVHAREHVRPRTTKELRRDVRRDNALKDIPPNNFLFEDDSKLKEEFCSGFSFGVYLEYWRSNKNNSVRPIYSNLKEELTMNRHATITQEEYEQLHRECQQLREEQQFSAKNIGIMNTVCGIVPGSKITVEHMICVKVYTDFTFQQNIFKKHCRRLHKDEAIESVMRRNSEIAHWCRLLRECIMFWGETMRESDVVYCGLNARLIFRSLHQRFECPLSTTMIRDVALQFAGGDDGIILTLKRSNPKTRFLNVALFTSFKNEDERLFSGSTLKIIDISIGSRSLKRYIKALRMLEQIANGHFIDFGVHTATLLLSLLHRFVAPSVMDVCTERVSQSTLRQYLQENDYDTDAVLEDIENMNDSNIGAVCDGDWKDILKLIKTTLGIYLIFISKPNDNADFQDIFEICDLIHLKFSEAQQLAILYID